MKDGDIEIQHDGTAWQSLHLGGKYRDLIIESKTLDDTIELELREGLDSYHFYLTKEQSIALLTHLQNQLTS